MQRMPSSPLLEIVIPTFNCVLWFDSLIESVLRQDFQDWRLVVRDNGSQDGTLERIDFWKQRLGDRLLHLPNPHMTNIGMIGNYNAVFEATTASWVMLSDPDDVWLPGKISLTIKKMEDTELQFGKKTPILVCTDAEVVNERLEPVAASYWKWRRMDPRPGRSLSRVVMDSPALTSTMAINRALLDLALPMTGAAACADWWPALIATAFGKMVLLPERTVLYRRHSSNDSKDPYPASIVGSLRRFLAAPRAARERLQQLLKQLAPQAQAFAERFKEQLDVRDLRAIEAAAKLPALDSNRSRLAILRHGLWFGSTVKNIGLLLLV